MQEIKIKLKNIHNDMSVSHVLVIRAREDLRTQAKIEWYTQHMNVLSVWINIKYIYSLQLQLFDLFRSHALMRIVLFFQVFGQLPA